MAQICGLDDSEDPEDLHRCYHHEDRTKYIKICRFKKRLTENEVKDYLKKVYSEYKLDKDYTFKIIQ